MSCRHFAYTSIRTYSIITRFTICIQVTKYLLPVFELNLLLSVYVHTFIFRTESLGLVFIIHCRVPMIKQND